MVEALEKKIVAMMVLRKVLNDNPMQFLNESLLVAEEND
jgi:hypothetical protein